MGSPYTEDHVSGGNIEFYIFVAKNHVKPLQQQVE